MSEGSKGRAREGAGCKQVFRDMGRFQSRKNSGSPDML